MTDGTRHSALLAAPHGFLGRGDRPADTLGLETDRLFLPQQYHSADAIYVSQDTPIAARADAVITDKTGLAVGVRTADCVPVLFYAPGWVGAAHAGWRGSLLGILEATVALFGDHGVPASALQCAIGPALRSPLFEVREDLKNAVTGLFEEAERFFTPTGDAQWDYDHIGFVRWRLIAAGLPADRIDDVGGNTLEMPEIWYSHRAGVKSGTPETGRNISAISLPPA